ILSQLKSLDEDLRLLHLWCESARSQIAKAIKIPEEEKRSFSKISSNPSIDQVAKPQFQPKRASNSHALKKKEEEEEPLASPEIDPQKQKWWKLSVSKLKIKTKIH
ncbi:MAG: hypothetical protein HYZ48_01190, partial [Chlamydiales bacterium]|nr:hypothetical protein [Chlamydiales bacterium]